MPAARVRRRYRLLRPEQQGSVEAKGGHGVGGREAPAGVVRLDDLEPMRDRFDAAQKRPLIHAGLGRASELEGDLGLNARLQQPRWVEPTTVAKPVQARVVHVAPNRGGDAVLGPDRCVGEADLAADNPLAAALSRRARTAAVT